MGKNTTTFTYDTFADLRLTTGDDSSSVTVLGGTIINDGNGGRFYYDTTSTSTEDNMNIIKPTPITEEGRWIRVEWPLSKSQEEGLQEVLSESKIYTDIKAPWYTPEMFQGSDTERIQQAITAAGVGGRIVLKPDTVYTIEDTLIIAANQTFEGYGATIKRANETVAATTNSIAPNTKTIIVNSIPPNWKVGDYIHVCVGDAISQTSKRLTIQSINVNTITTVENVGGTVTNGAIVFPAGSSVRKIFNILQGEQYPTPAPIKILGGTWDGNSANNGLNDFWYFNTMISVFGFGTKITGATFKDIPNECIVTAGAIVTSNQAFNLQGSFVHISSPNQYGVNLQGNIIANNFVDGVCLATNFNTGHSEAAITFSWNAGKTIVSGNRFQNSPEFPVDFTNPQVTSVGDGNEILVTNNYFKGFQGVAFLPTTNLESYQGRVIKNNVFHDCFYSDFSNLGNIPGIKFYDNDFVGNTNIDGRFNIQPAMTGLVNYGNATFQDGFQGFVGGGSVQFDKPIYFDQRATFRYQPIFEKDGQTDAGQAALIVESNDGGSSGVGFAVNGVAQRWLNTGSDLKLKWDDEEIITSANLKGGVASIPAITGYNQYSIPHGLGRMPVSAVVSPMNDDSKPYTLSYNTTDLLVTFVSPLPETGITLIYSWIAM